VRLQLGRNRNCKKDIRDDIYACVVSRKSNKLRIREKSDGVQNNPSRSINTIRHSVVCGASRCPDGRLVYSFCIIANLIAGSVRSIGDQWTRVQEYVKLRTDIRFAAPSPIVMWERLARTFYYSEATNCEFNMRQRISKKYVFVSVHVHSSGRQCAHALIAFRLTDRLAWRGQWSIYFCEICRRLRQWIVNQEPDARVRLYNA